MEEKTKEGGKKCRVRSRRDQRETTLFSGFPSEKGSLRSLQEYLFSSAGVQAYCPDTLPMHCLASARTERDAELHRSH